MAISMANNINFNAVANNLYHKYFFWKTLKIQLKNVFYKLFLDKHVLIAYKTKTLITFTSLIQIEWIKPSLAIKHILQAYIYQTTFKKEFFLPL